jgi:hypothetical protein
VPPRVFYGWIVVAIAFVTMGIGVIVRSGWRTACYATAAFVLLTLLPLNVGYRSSGRRRARGAEHIDIRIETQGPVNIYNCTSAPPCLEPPAPSPPEPCTKPIAPGQCVPLSIGSKPKQSLRTKLDSLLANTTVPSAVASAFFQHARRFAAGRAPANALETEVFDFFRALPAQMKSILSCSAAAFDGITPSERQRRSTAPYRRTPPSRWTAAPWPLHS